MPLGCKVTLRRERMYEFLDRLITIALPRVRDFRGLNPKSFDGRGNYAMGLKEQIVFPEINYDRIEKVRGMDVIVTTTAKSDTRDPIAANNKAISPVTIKEVVPPVVNEPTPVPVDSRWMLMLTALALIATDHLDAGTVGDGLPIWVIFTCAFAIALGTYLGGWRIIRTLGKGLVEISSPQGMAAEASSAAIILTSSTAGMALSTTHVATGSILGTGVGKKGGY